jgi:hypothetical protein
MPFWGAILLSLLAYAKAKYPDQGALIDAAIAALIGAWGGHLAESARSTADAN